MFEKSKELKESFKAFDVSIWPNKSEMVYVIQDHVAKTKFNATEQEAEEYLQELRDTM